MQVTGETAEYDALTPRCQACQAFVDRSTRSTTAVERSEFAGAEIVAIIRAARKTSHVRRDRWIVPETVISEAQGEQTALASPVGRRSG